MELTSRRFVFTGVLTAAFWLSCGLFAETPNANSISPTHPEENKQKGARPAGEILPDLSACPFLKRDDDLALVGDHWGLKGLGTRLLRKPSPQLGTPAFNSRGDFDGNAIAVIDSGLVAKDNPGAGSKIKVGSPERDYGDHGTFVNGEINSADHGFDPELSTVSYPVELTREGDVVISNSTPKHFKHSDLIEKVKMAIENPKVKVLNFSMSFNEDPELAALVEKGRKQGKLFVFGAGQNKGEAGSGTNYGIQKFKNDPGVFFVGSLNYFGAPASFTAAGSRVEYYAPGTHIPSLDAGYNSNLIGSRATLVSQGDSTSTPLFSALIGRMLAFHPGLGAMDIRDILEISNIKRSQSFPVGQINPVHAMRLLEAAESCLKTLGSDCVKNAEAKIQKTLKVPLPPAKDAHCSDWERYFESLQEGYFLSNASRSFSEPLAKLWAAGKKHSLAESVFYANPEDAGTALGKIKPPRHAGAEKEYEAAKQYFSGARALVAEPLTPEEIRNGNPFDLLKRLEPDPDPKKGNVKAFLSICLRPGQDMSWPCKRFLMDAPDAFRLEVAKELKNQFENDPKRKFTDPEVLSDLGLLRMGGDKQAAEESPSNHPNYELYEGLARRALKDWDGRIDEHFWQLSRFAEDLDTSARKDLYDDFKARRKNTEVQDRLAKKQDLTPEETKQLRESWGKPGLFAERDEYMKPRYLSERLAALAHSLAPSDIPPEDEKMLREASGPEEKAAPVGDFVYDAERAALGMGSPDKVIEDLRKVLQHTERANEKTNPGYKDAQEYGDHHFLSGPIARSVKNPAMANAYADFLQDEGNRKKLGKVLAGDSAIHTIIEKAEAPQGERLFKDSIEDIKKAGDGEGIYYVAMAHPNLPAAKDLLRQITEGEPQDPLLKQARLAYLAQQLKAKKLNPTEAVETMERLGGSKYGLAGSLWRVEPEEVRSNPALFSAIEKRLKEVEAGKPNTHLFGLVGRASDENFKRLIPDFQSRLPLLFSSEPVKKDDYRQGDTAVEFADRLARTVGGDSKTMGPILELTHHLWDQKKTRNPDMIEFWNVVGHTKPGQAYLVAHPQFAKELADGIISHDVHFPKQYRATQLKLSAPLRDQIWKQVPRADALDKFESVPRWLGDGLLERPDAVPTLLYYLRYCKNQRNVETIEYFLKETLAANPELVTDEMRNSDNPSVRRALPDENSGAAGQRRRR